MAMGVKLNWLANWVVAFSFPLIFRAIDLLARAVPALKRACGGDSGKELT